MLLLHSSIALSSIVHLQHAPIFNSTNTEAAPVAALRNETMSMLNDVNDTRSRPSRFAGALGGLNRRFEQYKTYRQTLAELETLSDRELLDLGISRQNLRAIAYQAAYEG